MIHLLGKTPALGDTSLKGRSGVKILQKAGEEQEEKANSESYLIDSP